jgi:hypothetical protein
VSPFWQNSTAPYGPVFLLVAAGVMCVAGSHVVLGVLGMRLVVVLALIAMAPLCLALARRYGVERPTALWLGLMNPLVLCHFVSGAHNDALIVVLVLAAMLLAAQERPLLAAAIIAVAVLIKASALVAIVFLVPAAGRRIAGRRIGGRWPLVSGAAAVTLVVGVTMSLITAALNAWYGWIGALTGTTRARNGLSLSTDLGLTLERFTPGVSWPVDPVTLTRGLGLVAAALLLPLIMMRTRGKPVYGLGLALVMVIALGPVVHPWYLLWGFIPLAVSTRNPRVIQAVVGFSVLMLFFSGPSGGGPSPHPAFAVLGVVVGIVGCWLAWPARERPVQPDTSIDPVVTRKSTAPSSAATS